jgi:hypothetical protein
MGIGLKHTHIKRERERERGDKERKKDDDVSSMPADGLGRNWAANRTRY